MSDTAAEIAARFGLRRTGRVWSGMCPACGYRTGLRVQEKAGRVLWWCASCQDQEAVTAAITGAAPAREASSAPATHDDTEDRRRLALRMWDDAIGWQGMPPAIYLAQRLGGVLPAGLQDLAFLREGKHPDGRRHPVMLALLRDVEGRPVAVHRTFLAPGGKGKAPVEPNKMTLGPVRGAAVRLQPATDAVVIGEGIESSLAAGLLLKMPAWAAVSAGNLRDSLTLPPAIREIIIAADRDKPGLEAAAAAATRWKAEGRSVKIAKPDQEGWDFADLLLDRRRR